MAETTRSVSMIMAGMNVTSGDDVAQWHLEYTLHHSQVTLVNDIYSGTDTAIQYIFQFPQELASTYQQRKDRATLRNFVKRAVSAFVGMIFRKPIEYGNFGPKTTASLNTIDSVNTIGKFTRDVGEALTRDSIVYILADSPTAEGNSSYDKPYLMIVERLSLINWRKDEFGKFKMIVIQETVSEENGLFGTTFTLQWRHYFINEDGFVSINVYRLKDSNYYINESIDTTLDMIPIIEINIDPVPILYDIAKMNIKHLNRQSHKDRYLTMAALPIPVIWGAEINEDGTTTTAKPALVIGVDEAFIFNGTKDEADFQWRELSGASITLLEDDLNSIIEDITTGILRASETANAVQKTATEVQLLQAEASNRVTVIAASVERGVCDAIKILSYMNNELVPSNNYFIINKDFSSALMGSDGARVIMESYLLGLISMETYLRTLSDMELINIDSATKEMERIQKDTFVPRPRIEQSTTQVDNRTTSAVSNTPPNK